MGSCMCAHTYVHVPHDMCIYYIYLYKKICMSCMCTGLLGVHVAHRCTQVYTYRVRVWYMYMNVHVCVYTHIQVYIVHVHMYFSLR
jgi:hypothetical protein